MSDKNLSNQPKPLLDRVKKFIDLEFNGSIASLAKYADMPPSTLRAALTRENYLSSRFFAYLKHHRPQTNLNYFFDEKERNYDIITWKDDDNIKDLPVERQIQILEDRYMRGQRAMIDLLSINRQ